MEHKHQPETQVKEAIKDHLKLNTYNYDGRIT